MSSGSDPVSKEITKDHWTVHDIEELKEKFSDWLDDTVERLGGELEVSGRVDGDQKLHLKFHDVVLSNPNDTGDEQDLYLTIERVEIPDAEDQ